MTACTVMRAPLVMLPPVMGVELWRVELDETVSDDVHVLSSSERARAERFVFERDRRRYVNAHVALRRVLAGKTGEAPHRLTFEDNAFGKPSLADGSCAFNLSHSEDVALIAVAEAGSIGVDIEVLRSVADAGSLADSLYTATERAEIAASQNHDHGFLCCWTRKEACVKAVGLGLSIEPRTFEAGAQPIARTIAISVDGAAIHVGVESIHAGEHCVAAVARVVSHH